MDHSIGGSPSIQVFFGLLGAATTSALFIAYINIKRLQIDQHRAWMIRDWAWAATIISLRLILLAAQHVYETYDFAVYMPIRCKEIFFMYSFYGVPDRGNPTALLYPQCSQDAKNNPIQVAVTSAGSGPESSAALLRANFEMSAWLAFIIHIFLTELYLWMTPDEHHRLRVVSYEKQVAKGMRKKGQYKDAGLGATRIGDAPDWWSLPRTEYEMAKQIEESMSLEQKHGSQSDHHTESQ